MNNALCALCDPTEGSARVSILPLAIALLVSGELRKWFAIRVPRYVRRMLLKLPPPFDKLAWLGLPSAEKYNRWLMEKYYSEPR
jgi:hypothetical protein